MTNDLNHSERESSCVFFIIHHHLLPKFWTMLLGGNFLYHDVLVCFPTQNNVESKEESKWNVILWTGIVQYFNSVHTNSTVLVQMLAYLLGRFTFCIRSFSSRNRIFENTSLGILPSLYLSSVELQQSSVAESSSRVTMFPPALALVWGRCDTYDAVGLLVHARCRGFSCWCLWLIAVKFQEDQIFLRPLMLSLGFGWRSKWRLKCPEVVATVKFLISDKWLRHRTDM